MLQAGRAAHPPPPRTYTIGSLRICARGGINGRGTARSGSATRGSRWCGARLVLCTVCAPLWTTMPEQRPPAGAVLADKQGPLHPILRSSPRQHVHTGCHIGPDCRWRSLHRRTEEWGRPPPAGAKCGECTGTGTAVGRGRIPWPGKPQVGQIKILNVAQATAYTFLLT